MHTSSVQHFSIAAIFTAVVFAQPVEADEGFQTALPRPGFAFALNPETGGLAVVIPKENQVVLYPRFVATGGKGEPVVVRVGKLPVAIVYKKFGDRSYFAVVSHDDRELTILDAVTLKAARTRAHGTVAIGCNRIGESGRPKHLLRWTQQGEVRSTRTSQFGIDEG